MHFYYQWWINNLILNFLFSSETNMPPKGSKVSTTNTNIAFIGQNAKNKSIINAKEKMITDQQNTITNLEVESRYLQAK